MMQSGGGRYDVPTGRRDGFESLAQNVDLPSPTISVSDSIAKFAGKGLGATDMVYLLGTSKHLICLLHILLLNFIYA
jgi:peroxidase